MTYDLGRWDRQEPRTVEASDEKEAAEKVCDSAHFQLYFWLTGAQRQTSYSAAHRQAQSCLRRVATEVQPVAISLASLAVIRRWPLSASFLAAGNTGVPDPKVRLVATLQSHSCDWGGPPDD